MSNSAHNLLTSFDALPEVDQHEVLVELLRRMAESKFQSPSDDELLLVADMVFQEFDRQEEFG